MVHGMQKLALIAKNTGRRSGSQALPAATEAVGKLGANTFALNTLLPIPLVAEPVGLTEERYFLEIFSRDLRSRYITFILRTSKAVLKGEIAWSRLLSDSASHGTARSLALLIHLYVQTLSVTATSSIVPPTIPRTGSIRGRRSPP